jgi:hypothetical protein
MAAGRATCTFCDAEIDASRDYRRVHGWEKYRVQGGTNALACREQEDKWACRTCIERMGRGISLDQGTLI